MNHVPRPSFLRRAAALALVLVGACAPALKLPNGTRVETNGGAVRRAIAAARMGLDSALKVGDLPRTLRALAPDIVVVLPKGDSLVGREAVSVALNQRFEGAIGAGFDMLPTDLEVCMDGAVEYRGDLYVYVGRQALRMDTLQARYLAKWVNTGASPWLLGRLDLRRDAADRGPRPEVCERAEIAEFEGRRIRLSFSTPFSSIANRPTDVAIEDRIRSGGYTVGPVTKFNSPFNFTTLVQPWSVMSVRVRLWRGLWINAIGELGAQTIVRAGTLPPDTLSGVRVEYEGRSPYGAMLEYEWRHWYLSAGAAPYTATWRGFQDTPDSLVVSGIHRTFTSASSSTTTFVFGGGYTLPLGSVFFLDFRAVQRLGQVTFPKYGSASGGTVSVNALTVGAFIGLAF